jgi:hypothetical protein
MAQAKCCSEREYGRRSAVEVELHRTHGVRNDLLVVIDRRDVDAALLNIANRDRLMRQPGLTRHRELTAEEREANRSCKIAFEEHLNCLGLLGADGRPRRRSVAIGNRNLGNNHGAIAWHADQTPPLFHVRDDPLNYPAYSCLIARRDGRLEIRDLRFSENGLRVHDAEQDLDLSEHVAWATYGQRVLRGGQVVHIEEIIDQFYDIRHVLAYDHNRPEGRKIASDLYQGYPDKFRANALHAWRDLGVPRNRYLHNCIGLSHDSIFILQREGTPEEVGHWLRESGAEDGIILDNGGSVACWAWWIYPKGGFLFSAPDFRPPASSILAFILKAPVRVDLPGGSVSYTTV